MQIARRLTAAVVAATMIGGCASSGGGGTATATYADGSTRELTLQEFFVCLLTAGLLCPRSANESTATASAASTGSNSSSSSSRSRSSTSSDSTSSEPTAPSSQGGTIPSSPVPFTSWQDHRGGGGAIARALGATAVISRAADEGVGDAIKGSGGSDGGSITVLYDAAGALSELKMYDRSLFPRADAPSPVDHPEIDMAWSESNASQTVFADVPSDTSALIANPYALDWSYQSFGVWNSPDQPTQERVFAVSYGAATPGAAVPTDGAATFTGKLAGLLVQPSAADYMVAANVRLQVDFGQRSVSLASSGTSIMRDGVGASAAPGLDLSGTMTYVPGSSNSAGANTFSDSFMGTLTTADASMSGTSHGRFHGPAAEELGGVFLVKSPTGAAFTGAYGAKR